MSRSAEHIARRRRQWLELATKWQVGYVHRILDDGVRFGRLTVKAVDPSWRLTHTGEKLAIVSGDRLLSVMDPEALLDFSLPRDVVLGYFIGAAWKVFHGVGRGWE